MLCLMLSMETTEAQPQKTKFPKKEIESFVDSLTKIAVGNSIEIFGSTDTGIFATSNYIFIDQGNIVEVTINATTDSIIYISQFAKSPELIPDLNDLMIAYSRKSKKLDWVSLRGTKCNCEYGYYVHGFQYLSDIKRYIVQIDFMEDGRETKAVKELSVSLFKEKVTKFFEFLQALK